jgi:hypothetical protein
MFHVRESQIHGQGIFASKTIRKGAVIGTVQGRQTKRNGPYVLWLSERQGLLVQNELKYINHSPRPNAAYLDDATVVALRTIRTGEEITHDYSGQGDDWEGD